MKASGGREEMQLKEKSVKKVKQNYIFHKFKTPLMVACESFSSRTNSKTCEISEKSFSLNKKKSEKVSKTFNKA